MKYDITNTKDYKQVDNALQSVQKDLSEHQEQEKRLRKNIDDISEELADARVDFATQEITAKQRDKVVSKHENAQMKLVRHGKNKETLKAAIGKLKEKKERVFADKVDELRPKAQKAYKNKMKTLADAAEKMNEALLDVQEFANNSHQEYNLPTISIKLQTTFNHRAVKTGLSNLIDRCNKWISNN